MKFFVFYIITVFFIVNFNAQGYARGYDDALSNINSVSELNVDNLLSFEKKENAYNVEKVIIIDDIVNNDSDGLLTSEDVLNENVADEDLENNFVDQNSVFEEREQDIITEIENLKEGVAQIEKFLNTSSTSMVLNHNSDKDSNNLAEKNTNNPSVQEADIQNDSNLNKNVELSEAAPAVTSEDNFSDDDRGVPDVINNSNSKEEYVEMSNVDAPPLPVRRAMVASDEKLLEDNDLTNGVDTKLNLADEEKKNNMISLLLDHDEKSGQDSVIKVSSKIPAKLPAAGSDKVADAEKKATSMSSYAEINYKDRIKGLERKIFLLEKEKSDLRSRLLEYKGNTVRSMAGVF